MNRKLKKSVVYSMYALSLSMLIGGIILLEINSKKLKSNNNIKDDNYQYVSKTGIEKKDIPVVNTKNVLIRPYKDSDVKVLKAMDHNLDNGKSSDIIPVTLKKDGGISGAGNNNACLNKEQFDKTLNELKNIAEKKLNCSLAQLAIAWTIVNPDVSTCIIGATKASQVEENCKALEVAKKLDNQTLIEIEKILNNAPKGEIDFRTWKELPSRRNVALGLDYIREKK